MVSTWTLDRARCAIEKLSRARLDWPSFSEQVISHLQRSVGFDGWCLGQTDPDTLLAGQARCGDSPVARRQDEFWRNEYQRPDLVKFAALARGGPRVAALSAATRGDLSRSSRWARVLGPAGAGDEIRGALVAGGGCWGSLTLYRVSSARPFTGADTSHLTTVLACAAVGARGTWTSAGPAAPAQEGGDGPGTIIVTAAGTPVTATAEAGRWLARLGQVTPAGHPVIAALTALVTAPAGSTGPAASTGSAGSSAPAASTASAARARTRAADGCWLDLHAARLAGARPGSDVAITLQAASPARISPLLMRAYGLSARERQIASQILGGRTDGQIARALHLSPHTIHDHGKAILRKTATHSRPQLIRCLTGQPA